MVIGKTTELSLVSVMRPTCQEAREATGGQHHGHFGLDGLGLGREVLGGGVNLSLGNLWKI